MTDEQVKLVTEQIRHGMDLVRGDIRELRQELAHTQEMMEQRMGCLEETVKDHEERLRSATEGVTQFKVWSGLAAGGSGFMSILALVKAWLGH